MTHSIIDVQCKHCDSKYHGILKSIFQSNGEYATTCKDCKKQNFIKWGAYAAAVNLEVPEGAVPVYPVKVL